MTEAEARVLIESMTAWDSVPALSSAQVTLLVRGARRSDADGVEPTTYDEWAASTAYVVGDKVYPTVRNGHYYEVTVAGTSDTAEPDWPTDDGDTVVDNTVTFAEAGVDPWAGHYDLNAAAAEGWRWKAATVAGAYDFAADGQTFNRAEMARACREMATIYRNRVVGSMPLMLVDTDAELIANG